MITIAYLTNRRNPQIEWFFDSLHNECGGNYDGIKILVIDYWAQEDGRDWSAKAVKARRDVFKKAAHCEILHIPPKPSVWQGAHRLAKINYFAASNTRNTALCHAEDGYICFVDDLAVLLPGWLAEVRNAITNNWIALSAYSKVLNLDVRGGAVHNYVYHPHGRDSRLDHVQGENPHIAGGSWCYGCSLAIPVEALLKINGFDEDCDSMGFEDVICGIMLQRNGNAMMYCPRMRTLESEELHFVEKPFARIIKKLVPESTYPDASHAILDWVLKGRRVMAPNYQNMRELRQHVLGGGEFPILQIPEHDWRDKQPIREMDQTR